MSGPPSCQLGTLPLKPSTPEMQLARMPKIRRPVKAQWEDGMERRRAATRGTSRRTFIAGGAAAGSALALGVKAPYVLAQARPPLRIGIINTMSGILAHTTESNLRGMSLYFDRSNWTVAGRKIELIQEDDQFNPQIGLQKARKLVESDHVDLICGPQASNVALALLNYTKETKTFMLVWAGTDAITWERIPTLFRPSISTWQVSTPMAGWVHDNVAQEIVLIASDFAAGHDVLRTFKSAYLPKGGKVIKEIYPPLGTTDFGPYLTDVLSLKPPAAYAFFTGTDSVRFVQQYAEFGLKDKIRLLGFTALVDGTTIEAQGKAALGIVTAQTYVDTLDNPANRAFVAEYRSRHGAFPDLYSDYGYVTARVIAESLTKTGGDTARDRWVEALANVAFDAPRGPFRFDPVTHNVIQNVYITEVQEIEGRLTHKALVTIPDVRDPGVKPG
jgi:branched-chain amino acid transport system substrate-binding protein